jgi:hypothetical protein
LARLKEKRRVVARRRGDSARLKEKRRAAAEGKEKARVCSLFRF